MFTYRGTPVSAAFGPGSYLGPVSFPLTLPILPTFSWFFLFFLFDGGRNFSHTLEPRFPIFPPSLALPVPVNCLRSSRDFNVALGLNDKSMGSRWLLLGLHFFLKATGWPWPGQLWSLSIIRVPDWWIIRVDVFWVRCGGDASLVGRSSLPPATLAIDL